MRILSVGNCQLDPFLGSGKSRLRWAAGFRALGHTFDVLEPKDIEWWPFVGHLKHLRLARGAQLRVRRALREANYDIVEFCGGEFGWITRELAARQDRPLIIARTDGLELLAYYGGAIPDVSRSGPFWPPRRFYESLKHRLDFYAFRYADRFASLSWADHACVVKHGLFDDATAQVVPPGIDPEFLGRPFSPGDPQQLAYAGTWTERKNPAAIVTVTSRLLRQRPDLTFNIFGSFGSAELILAAYPAELRNRVVVHPKLAIADLTAGLSRCGVFFFPSLYEGFGMTLAEAMGSSCAAVTTPTGFGAELTPGKDVMICAAQDLAGFERTILQLLDDEARRVALARSGWEHVQPLRWDAQAARLEGIYRGWLDEWQRTKGVRS
jgi:glycosyltransferase involved in cell wall biosynthesis